MRDHLQTIIIFLLLFLAAVSTVSCGGETPAVAPTIQPTKAAATSEPAPEETADIPFSTIAQDAPLGDEPADPAYTVVAAPEGWSDLQNQLPSEAMEAGRDADPSQLILIAFTGAKASSGYSSTIETIRRQADQLIVTVSEQAPGENDIVEPAMTLPFHVVAVPNDEVPEGVTAVHFQSESGQPLSQHPYPQP
jgi:hypothetical protein